MKKKKKKRKDIHAERDCVYEETDTRLIFNYHTKIWDRTYEKKLILKKEQENHLI